MNKITAQIRENLERFKKATTGKYHPYPLLAKGLPHQVHDYHHPKNPTQPKP